MIRDDYQPVVDLRELHRYGHDNWRALYFHDDGTPRSTCPSTRGDLLDRFERNARRVQGRMS